MDHIPTEILLGIFRMYLEEPSMMPIPLMGVCRHWYGIIKATPSLFYRVAINVKTENTIPFILASPGLERYLSYTDTGERDRNGCGEVLLDVEIRCHLPSAQEHDAICDSSLAANICQRSLCKYALKRRCQIDQLLAYLLGPGSPEFLAMDAENSDSEFTAPFSTHLHQTGIPITTTTSPADPSQSTHIARNRNRIERWRSLDIEWDRLLSRNTPNFRHDPDGFLSNTQVRAPRLVHLGLNGVLPGYMPYDTFAPNITSLSIVNTWFEEPKFFLKLESLWVGGLTQHWSHRGRVGFGTVVELHVICTQWKHVVECPELPRLRVMKMYQRCSSPNFPHNIKPFDLNLASIDSIDPDEARRLEEVHLIDITAPTLVALRNVEAVTGARKIVLHNTPGFSTTPVAAHGELLDEEEKKVLVQSYKELRFIKLLRQSVELLKFFGASSTKPSRNFQLVEPITPPLLPSTPPSSPLASSSLTSASSSVSSLLSISSTDSFETSSPGSLLKVFMRACTIDTEFVAVDENSAKCLEIAVKRVEARR